MAIANEIDLHSSESYQSIGERTLALMDQVSVNLSTLSILAENNPIINESDGTAIENAYYLQAKATIEIKQIFKG